MNRRGLTPIIAVILLLMMTIAAAGAAFYWIVKIQGQLQGGTEQYQETTFERMASTVNVNTADYFSVPNTLNVTLFNAGTIDTSLYADSTDPTLRIVLKNYNQTAVCTSALVGSDASCTSGCNNTLSPGALKSIAITLGGACSISNYSSGDVFYFDLYFSGKGTASGQFKKT